MSYYDSLVNKDEQEAIALRSQEVGGNLLLRLLGRGELLLLGLLEMRRGVCMW